MKNDSTETATERIEKKVDRIETAFYGTGNPQGGLFQQFSALEGKVTALDAKFEGKFTALDAKIDGVENQLESKIEGVEEIFNKVFSFAKWVVGIAVVLICAVVVPIFIEVVLPIIRKWIENF